MALDPANPAVLGYHGLELNAAPRFVEAETMFRRVTDLSPSAPWGHDGISLNLTTPGRFDEAAQAAMLPALEWERLFVLALARWGQGRRPEADAVLAELDRRFAEIAAYQVAEVHAFRRDADRAFEWLDRAHRQRDPGLAWIRPGPLFDSLRSDPRWPAFLRKIGLHDEQVADLR